MRVRQTVATIDVYRTDPVVRTTLEDKTTSSRDGSLKWNLNPFVHGFVYAAPTHAAEGERVWLHCPSDSEGPCHGRLVGRPVASDEDRLTLDVGLRDPVVVERRHVARLDVSRGRQTGRGASRGAVIGGAVLGLASLGLMAALHGADDPDMPIRAADYVLMTAVGASVGVLGGTATGALIGAGFREAGAGSGSARAHIPDPAPEGAALALSMRF
jgi:hypothetical protein